MNLWFIAIPIVLAPLLIWGVVWMAKKNADPDPRAGLGDQPAWLRNGEEERGPHGKY